MTTEEKVNLMNDIASVMKLSQDEVGSITSGYPQVLPNGEHQLVLLFGYDEKKNSINKKLRLHDETEALEAYQALTHFISTKTGRSRPRLSKSKQSGVNTICSKDEPIQQTANELSTCNSSVAAQMPENIFEAKPSTETQSTECNIFG